MYKLEKAKVHIVFLGMCLCFIIVISKAFVVQVINREKLQHRYERQFFRVNKVYSNRGNILDRNGEPLAINIQTYSIFSIPKNVKNGNVSYERLAKIVPQLTLGKILNKVKNRSNYTFLARKIVLTKEQVNKVKSLSENGGIYIEAVPKRTYPNHELLSQLLGIVGVDNVGLSGLEYQFDERLRGTARVTKYIQDAKGRAIKFQSKSVHRDSEDLHLSIDIELQAVAEKALKDVVKEFEAERGGVGVIDATTGEILAIGNYPSYDPNEMRASKAEHRRLGFVTDPIEPGSIFKTLTVASAFSNKIARPDTNYYCERGSFQIGKYEINEAESRKKYEWLSVAEILRYSSNIGTTKIAFDITFPKLRETLKKFRIGEKTGVEIPGESRGIFSQEQNVSPISLSNISFGQGVATTGVQMLAAYGAIANGGYYLPPTIIKGKKRSGEQIILKETADELTDILASAVENGTGGNAKIKYFKIAGKTSTAQRPDESGSYSGYIPGFIGFPINIKKPFVIYAYVEAPKGDKYYGNIVAAPIFKKVAQYILYKRKEYGQVEVQPVEATSKKRLEPPKKKSRRKIYARGQVPSFIGLDKKSAMELADKYSFQVIHRGVGVVTKQMPSPGSRISNKTVVKLTYKPPKYE